MTPTQALYLMGQEAGLPRELYDAFKAWQQADNNRRSANSSVRSMYGDGVNMDEIKSSYSFRLSGSWAHATNTRWKKAWDTLTAINKEPALRADHADAIAMIDDVLSRNTPRKYQGIHRHAA